MPTVAIIEDDKNIRKVFRTCLELQNWNVIEFVSGVEALKHVRELENSDVILLDYMMPEMDGLEVLDKLRAIDKFLPIVICTAHGSVEVAKGFLRSPDGATDYVHKPIDSAVLDVTLRGAIEREKMRIDGYDEYCGQLELNKRTAEKALEEERKKQHDEKLREKHQDQENEFFEHLRKNFGEKPYTHLSQDEIHIISESMGKSYKTVCRIVERLDQRKQ